MVLPKGSVVTIYHPALGKYGRLGNQLWQIASTIGIARRYNAEPEFHHWDYEKFFSVPARYFVDEPSGTDVTTYATYMAEHDRFCLQDYNMFAGIASEIHTAFRPSPLTVNQLSEYRWFYELENKCCLHIRRDERVYREVLWRTHPIPSMAYYYDAINFLGSDYNYVVFSDDIAWCREAFEGLGFHFVEGYPRREETYGSPNEPEIRDHLDLLLMTDCVRHVIPNSSYSWWGAFLAEAEPPIYPDPWYGPDLAHVDATLQFPEDWIKLKW